MLPKHIRTWCRAKNVRWSEDPVTKYRLVLQAYRELDGQVPPEIQRRADKALAANRAPTSTTRKRARPTERPPSHYCPISHDVMVDPVIAPDGHSYEQAMLERWLRVNRTSPLTQEPVPAGANLVRNHALRKAIEEHNA